MATPQNQSPSFSITNKSEIFLLVQALPEYHPGLNLSLFINEVDNLVNHLKDRLTVDLVYILNCSIRSKVKGEARDFLAYNNATDWPEIRKTLLQKYGDQRSEELLVSALSQCVQNRGETYLQYYSRLLESFNSLMQNIILNVSDSNYPAA